MDSIAGQQSASADCTEISPVNVDLSAVSVSAMPANKYTFDANETNEPSSSLMTTLSDVFITCVHAKHAWHMVRSRNSSSESVLFGYLVSGCSKASASWCLIRPRFTLLDLNHRRLNRYCFRFLVLSIMAKKDQNSSSSMLIVDGILCRLRLKIVAFHATSKYSQRVSTNFCSFYIPCETDDHHRGYFLIFVLRVVYTWFACHTPPCKVLTDPYFR